MSLERSNAREARATGEGLARGPTEVERAAPPLSARSPAMIYDGVHETSANGTKVMELQEPRMVGVLFLLLRRRCRGWPARLLEADKDFRRDHPAR